MAKVDTYGTFDPKSPTATKRKSAWGREGNRSRRGRDFSLQYGGPSISTQGIQPGSEKARWIRARFGPLFRTNPQGRLPSSFFPSSTGAPYPRSPLARGRPVQDTTGLSVTHFLPKSGVSARRLSRFEQCGRGTRVLSLGSRGTE